MIIKTLEICCDHEPDLCDATFEGPAGESRALVVVRLARRVGWVATNGRQFCPKHAQDGRYH